jgi:hypothetical protein
LGGAGAGFGEETRKHISMYSYLSIWTYADI